MKKGDYVRCIKELPSRQFAIITKGRCYKILSLWYDGNSGVVIKDDTGKRVEIISNRFEPVKVAVHCKTEEEWARVKVAMKTDYPVWDQIVVGEESNCILENERGWCGIEYSKREGYHIISAQEYLGDKPDNLYFDIIGTTTITFNGINIPKGEDKMNISDNVFEVFNKEDMKKVQERFGAQYGDTDRDLLALKRDKTDLLKIIKKEEEAADKD